MLKRNYTVLCVLLCCMLFLFSSCADKNNGLQQEILDIKLDPKTTEDWVTYEKDGLVVRHPEDWKLKYDESPTLYADRAVKFEISDMEVAYIYLFNESDVPLDTLKDPFLSDFRLYESEYSKNIKEKNVSLNDYQGIIISYSDTFTTPPLNTEIALFSLNKGTKSVFSTFILNDEKKGDNRSLQSNLNDQITLNQGN